MALGIYDSCHGAMAQPMALALALALGLALSLALAMATFSGSDQQSNYSVSSTPKSESNHGPTTMFNFDINEESPALPNSVEVSVNLVDSGPLMIRCGGNSTLDVGKSVMVLLPFFEYHHQEYASPPTVDN